MHANNIVHRDLKPKNILFVNPNEDDLYIKIVDFGLSCLFDPSKGITDAVGTSQYKAPEIWNEDYDRNYNEKVDTWALGVIAFKLLVGSYPFTGKTRD